MPRASGARRPPPGVLSGRHQQAVPGLDGGRSGAQAEAGRGQPSCLAKPNPHVRGNGFGCPHARCVSSAQLDKVQAEQYLLASPSPPTARGEGQVTEREALARKKRDAQEKRVEVAKSNYDHAVSRLRNVSTPMDAPRRRAPEP